MRRRASLLSAIISIGVLALPSWAEAEETSLTGDWYGVWHHDAIHYGSVFHLIINQESSFVVINIPEVGLLDQPLPAGFSGDSLEIYFGPYALVGDFDGETIVGSILYNTVTVGTWQVYPQIEGPILPASAPGPSCENLPDLYVVGPPAYAMEILPFDPDFGAGYIDYPVNGETWDNQFRSYARRDLIQLVKHATAKIECKTSDWDYWSFAPLGLVDMSESDGSIPGTSVGYPGHPPGTHEDGNDMDLAYYQLNTPDNSARDIGYHYDGYDEVYHLTSEPFCLDPLRTALFISYLAEHPHLRVIGVDGQAGLIIEDALDILVAMGWIDENHRNNIPLAYEVEDEGYGWFLFHHHHLHVSMVRIHDIVSLVEVEPGSLNKKSKGQYITVYLELDEEYDLAGVDAGSLALIVNGQTAVPAVESKVQIADYNSNGIPDLTMKFDRQTVIDAIGSGFVNLAITGSVEGVIFQGTDTIHVLN